MIMHSDSTSWNISKDNSNLCSNFDDVIFSRISIGVSRMIVRRVRLWIFAAEAGFWSLQFEMLFQPLIVRVRTFLCLAISFTIFGQDVGSFVSVRLLISIEKPTRWSIVWLEKPCCSLSLKFGLRTLLPVLWTC